MREGEADQHIREWDEEWNADVWTEQPDSEESPNELRIPMALRRVSTLGASLPTLVFQGLDSGILEQRDASLLLDTGIKHFPAIRELLAQRREAYA